MMGRRQPAAERAAKAVTGCCGFDFGWLEGREDELGRFSHQASPGAFA